MPEGDSASGTSSGTAPAAPAAPAAPSAPATPVPSSPAAGGQAPGGLAQDAEASIIGSQSNGQVASFVRADGSFENDWTNKLPEDLGDARQGFGKYKNVNELVRGLHNANQVIGRKGVILPTPESTPEELTAFRKTMGVPENPDGYADKVRPAELPEGVQWNDEIARSYYEVAHRHNISAEGMKELIALNVKQKEFEQQAQIGAIQETKRQGLAHLRQIWGSNFDRNLGIAQRAATLAGVDANSYGWRDPEVVRGYVFLASQLGEDKLVAPGGSLPVGAADLKSRAIDIMTNKANPLYQKYRNNDRETQQLVRRYLEQAEAGK